MKLELNNVYNMDCMEGMAEFPDNYFALAIVDPPYGIGFAGFEKHYGGGKAKAKTKIHKPFYGNDKNPPSKGYFKELFRISKNQIIWGANHFIKNINKNSSCWIVWDKKNGENCFADCELAWASFNTAVRKFEYRWQGMLQENMKNKEIRIHPTQKPIALYKWILKNYAKEGDKILDTHVGSGSSIIACIDMKFEYIGFELDKDYYTAMMERINQFKAQGVLF